MLRKVSFHGFKSFADPVHIDFSNGITAIVGPNGCGKSNIFDGIRWVLGETSAKSLRGGNMKDIIFSGCDTRRAKDSAEVTLTLDNSSRFISQIDLDTITVTRRTFSSGKSDYFINNEAARLKDIQELFLDSGIGSSSYSMIGQEQTKKLLSSNTEERRAIFEEAAGIVKLKLQKKAAEKNLDAVSSDLTRLEDILKEVEKQLFPLRDQAAKTKLYQEYSKELKEIEIQFLLHFWDQAEKALCHEQDLSNTQSSELLALTKAMEEEETELDASKSEADQKNELMHSIQEEIGRLKEETERCNGLIALANERMENAKAVLDENQKQLAEIEKTHSVSAEEFTEKKRRIHEIEKELAALEESKTSLSELSSQLIARGLELKSEVEYTRKKTTDIYNEHMKAELEYHQLNRQEEDTQRSLQTMEDELKKCVKEQKESSRAETELHQKLTLLQSESTALAEEAEALSSAFRTFEKELDGLRSSYRETDENWNRKRVRLESLETSVHNNDGYFEGVKSVLSALKKGSLKGVCGVVAELIRSHKGYEKAIETLLQGSIQHLIVEDESVAKEAVAMLKKQKGGRATFLPLNLATPLGFNKEEAKAIRNWPGIHPALHFVSYEDKHEPVIQAMLGRAIVSDTMDNALSFLKKYNYRLKISTQDGDLIQKGAITGGTSGTQKAGFLTKQRELEQIRTEVSTLFDEANTLQARIQKKEAVISDNRRHLSARQEDLIKVKSNLEQVTVQYESCRRSNDILAEKLQQLKTSRQEMEGSLTDTKRTSSKLSYQISDQKSLYTTLQEELDRLLASEEETTLKLNEANEKRTETLLAIQMIQEESKNLGAFFDDYSEDHQSVESKMGYLCDRNRTEQSKLTAASNEKAEYTALYEQNHSLLKEREQLFERLKEKTRSLTLAIASKEESVKNKRAAKEQLEKALATLGVSISKKTSDMENASLRLLETYGIHEEEIPSIPRLPLRHQENQKLIMRLKKQITALGNINHGAIEECALLEERYAEEKKQVDDVKSAKTNLSKLLLSVENEMKERFIASFQEIAGWFEKTFVDLFGGGKAKLSLAEPKRPLDSPITIVAQPPGKKPQSIDLLSGGERNFTAVALIFAIISAKPSPFVYLDEVDAPLDEVNVLRYAEYIKKFSQHSQFIIVTHRIGTMRSADRLYGITTQEPGVSTVFPRPLDEELLQQRGG